MYSIDEKIAALIRIHDCGEYAIDDMSKDLFADIDIANSLLRNAIKNDPKILGMIPDKIRNNRDYAIKAVKANGYCIKYLSDEFKSDKEFALAALESNPKSREFLDREILNDFDVGIEIVKQSVYKSGNEDFYGFIDPRLLDDKEFALAALGYTVNIYENLSKRLRADYDICHAAASKLGPIIEEFGNKFRSDKEICLAAAKSWGTAIEFMDRRLRDDYDVAMAAVLSDGHAIKYLSKELKNNKDIALAAVGKCALIRDLGEDIRKDKDVVLKAMSGSRGNACSIPDEFKMDRDVVLAAMSRFGEYFENIDPAFKNDKEIVIAAVKSYGRAIRHIGDKLELDKEIALAAIGNDREVYVDLPDKLKFDRDVIEAAFAPGFTFFLKEWAIEDADDGLKKTINKFAPAAGIVPADENLSRSLSEFEKALASVEEYRGSYYCTNYKKLDIQWRLNKAIARSALEKGMNPNQLEDALLADKEFVLESIKMLEEDRGKGILFGEHLPNELLCDRNFAISLVEIDGEFLEYLPDMFQRDKDIVLTAVTSNGEAIYFAHETCFLDIDFVKIMFSKAFQKRNVRLFYRNSEELMDKLRKSLDEEQIASLMGFCKAEYIKPQPPSDHTDSSNKTLSSNNLNLEACVNNVEKTGVPLAARNDVEKPSRNAMPIFRIAKENLLRFLVLLARRIY